MNVYEYKGQSYTVNQLSEISGIAPHTLRDRFRRGYTVEEAIKQQPINDSVKLFCEASWYQDWIGMSTSYLHEIYWKWCVSHQYTPLTKQGFSRHLISMHPMLKTIPTKRGIKCNRIIRLRG